MRTTDTGAAVQKERERAHEFYRRLRYQHGKQVVLVKSLDALRRRLKQI